MTDPRRVAVVGAGAAGLTAALRAAESGAAVTLLNAHPKIGLKILMSGGTRCNVTHRDVRPEDFNGGSRNVIARILRAFPAEAARAWMESLGVSLKLERTGKYFPVTDDAQTVLDALIGACERAGVAIESGARVVRLASERGRFRLGIQTVASSAAFPSQVHAARATAWPTLDVTPDRWLEADAVVLSTGGLSFPRTGSDGTGYRLLTALGHTVTPTVPALTPLTADDPWCERLQGTAIGAELTLWSGTSRAVALAGPLLFTHFGYSGPVALDLSRHWLLAPERGRRVTLNLAPGQTGQEVRESWLTAAGEKAVTVRRHLWASLPDRLVTVLCEDAGVDSGARLAQVPREARTKLMELLTARELPVSGTLGFEKAEVTAGGVHLDEANASTLESRKVPGLFLCGEVLDVEGRLGGFNFQWSWSSGTVAGRAAGRFLVTEDPARP